MAGRIGPALALALVATLAACAQTPAACKGEAMKELQALDSLIAETRANIDRGYARSDGRDRGASTSVQLCLGSGSRHVGVSFCSAGSPTRQSGPVAIDPEAERRKLRSFESRRIEIARCAAAEAAACTAAGG